MSRARRHRRGSAHGAAAVEFALVLLPLLLVLLGTLDWGYYFYIRESIINAAREGARAGSIQRSSDEGISAANLYLSRVGLQQTARGCSGSAIADSACVFVEYDVGSITGFSDLVGIMPEHATARAVMRFEGPNPAP